MKYLLLTLILLSFKTYSYVIEDESEANKYNLTRHEGVVSCVFYPQDGKRPFYFSPKNSDVATLDYVISELQSVSLDNQVKCLESVFRFGDTIFRFNKKIGSSREAGYVVFRHDGVVAVVLTEAIYR